MSLQNGVIVGRVTKVKDPDGMGRVHIEFPWMEGNAKGYWAPVATMMSGGGRGSWFMPEEGDEVLVCFDHARADHPYIVGFLWNGKDKPPADDVDHEVRRIRTTSGHQLDFDDRKGGTKVEVSSSSGHYVRLDDKGGAVTVKTKDGHLLEMVDGPEAHILIKTSAGMSIEIDNKANMKVNSPVSVEVKTLKAKFTGIVEALQVKAKVGLFQSVIGKAYSNAPGNFH
ncbi:MAG: phage baseplate assembly protein V [Deltaproteobacteria bacterium]